MADAPRRLWVEVDYDRRSTSPRVGTAWDYEDGDNDVEYIRAPSPETVERLRACVHGEVTLGEIDAVLSALLREIEGK